MKKLFSSIKRVLSEGISTIKRGIIAAVERLDWITDIVVLKQIKKAIISALKLIWRIIRGIFTGFSKKKLNRSPVGDFVLIIVLSILGFFSAWPLLFIINNAFKPFDELFLFPPRLFVQNPTLKNFTDLMTAIESSWVPFTRYIFNTFYITLVGSIGHILIASMCAYPLAKYKFKGKKFIFTVIVLSLMFSSEVTSVPNFIIISKLGLLDRLSALILPALQFSLGLYLMKQFMEQVPDGLIEAAKIDGASHFQIYWKIMMPLSKPAWLTLGILVFQRLWGLSGGDYIYTEKLKTMNYALSQIVTGGVSRTGVSAALSLIMLVVPVVIFLICQSSVMETMTQSGMKD